MQLPQHTFAVTVVDKFVRITSLGGGLGGASTAFGKGGGGLGNGGGGLGNGGGGLSNGGGGLGNGGGGLGNGGGGLANGGGGKSLLSPLLDLDPSYRKEYIHRTSSMKSKERHPDFSKFGDDVQRMMDKIAALEQYSHALQSQNELMMSSAGALARQVARG
jgi:hypothetical protein